MGGPKCKITRREREKEKTKKKKGVMMGEKKVQDRKTKKKVQAKMTIKRQPCHEYKKGKNHRRRKKKAQGKGAKVGGGLHAAIQEKCRKNLNQKGGAGNEVCTNRGKKSEKKNPQRPTSRTKKNHKVELAATSRNRSQTPEDKSKRKKGVQKSRCWEGINIKSPKGKKMRRSRPKGTLKRKRTWSS